MSELTVDDVAALGSVVIVLAENGFDAAAFIHGRPAPCDIDVQYGEKDDPPQTIRRVTVKAGWTLEEWRTARPDERKTDA